MTGEERNHVCAVTLSLGRLSYKLPSATVGVYVQEMLEPRRFKAKDGIATEILRWFRQEPLYLSANVCQHHLRDISISEALKN
jgi:hypothetical protein